MTCAVDEILNGSAEAIRGAMEQLVQDLATDFNLELNVEQLLDSKEAVTVCGALQTFAVWAVQQGRKS